MVKVCSLVFEDKCNANCPCNLLLLAVSTSLHRSAKLQIDHVDLALKQRRVALEKEASY